MVAEGEQLAELDIYANSLFLGLFFHWKGPQSLPQLLDNVNKT